MSVSNPSFRGGRLNPKAGKLMKPFDLNGLKTYDLESRPSKVFHEDLGQPLPADATVAEWLDSLPRQLAGNALRRVRDHLCRAQEEGHTVVAALGGHVIKTGCAPYLIDWIRQGVIKAVAMNGSAAIHDFELALAGKTSEDVSANLHAGKFGMARETADAFAIAARAGAENEAGLGAVHWANTSSNSTAPTPTPVWYWPRIRLASLARFTSPWAPTSFTCIRTFRERPWVRHR